MWDLANALLRGLQIGSVYAIVGLGLNVIFAATGVFNFAQGELVMVGAMLGVSLWVASGFPLVVALVLVVLVTASIGALTEILAIRRLSNQRDATLWMLSTLGVAIIDAVEIDGELTAIGRRYFHLSGPRLHLYTADARPWLEASHARYDSIFLDAYRQPYIPFYLVTHEFFALARRHLNPGGTFIVNVGHLPSSNALEKVVSATLRSVFPYVVRDPLSADNSLVMASTRPLSGANLMAADRRVPLPLQGLMAAAAGRLGLALRGGPVYTDDWAPVEWLTDLSILRYAGGDR